MFSLLTLGATAYAASPPAPDVCATYRYFPPFECFGRWAAEFLGAAFLIITGFILGIVGVVFNKLVEISVIDFATFYDPMKTAVELGWSTFRDVANIAIIGGFVFVAISMILGVEKFGARRFVVNILIAAVLINFSLFFTKMIVDVSNLFASQFAQAISTSTTSANISIGQVAEPVGIAEAFLSYLKISSVLDSYGALQQLGSNTQSGFQVLLAAFLGSVFFMLAALVLLYACVLLLVRTVMIIMLLLLSALAFGAYAVPTFSNWFDRWWKELVKHALFAPLLMLFLWATAGISRALSGSEGSLGSLVTSPDSSVSVGTVVNFFIIIGLLLASIKIANSFSATAAKHMPNWKGAASFAATFGANKWYRPVRNLARYGLSARANRILEGEKGARIRGELANLEENIRKGTASGNEKARAAALQRRLGNLTADAEGRFGFKETYLGKQIAGFGKILKEGPGKGGVAASQQKAAQAEIEQAEKIRAPRSAEKQEAFEAALKDKNAVAQKILQDAKASEQAARSEAEKQISQLEREREVYRELMGAGDTENAAANYTRTEQALGEQRARIVKAAQSVKEAERTLANTPSEALKSAQAVAKTVQNERIETYVTNKFPESSYKRESAMSQLRKTKEDKDKAKTLEKGIKAAQELSGEDVGLKKPTAAESGVEKKAA